MIARSKTLFVLPILLMLIVTPRGLSAAGETYYVATDGRDSNSGTSSLPFRTINKGVTALKPGDKLYVKNGTYSESLTNNIPGGTSWDNPVILAAFPGHSVTIKPPVGSFHALSFAGQSQRYIIIDGFIIDGVNSRDQVIKIAQDHIRIQNTEIKTLSQSGIGIWVVAGDSSGEVGCCNEFIKLNIYDKRGDPEVKDTVGLLIESAGNLVERSTIHSNWGDGIVLLNDDFSSANNNVIRNNRIFNNGRGGSGDGLAIGRGTSNLAYNNVVFGNPGGISVGNQSQDAKIYNNTVYGNRDFGLLIDSGNGGSFNTEARNNIFYKNGSNVLDSGTNTVLTNNLESDPSFVDPANGDFHLQATSAAIDAGTAIAEVPDDYDGVTRPQGVGHDIGAHEFLGSPTVEPQSTLNATASSDSQPATSTLSSSTAGATTLTLTSASGGLVAAYGFNEGSGNTAIDSSGNNNSGIVSGATWTGQGKYGTALSFDGVDDYLSLGTLDIVSSAYTVTAWIKPTSFVPEGRIISKATGIQEQDHWWMLSTFQVGSQHRLRFRLKAGGTTTTLIASSGALAPGVWTHAVATYDGQRMRLYANGIEVGSVAKTGTIAQDPGVEVRVGGNPPVATSKTFHGVIDELHIYNRGLTQAEIQQVMDSPIRSGLSPTAFNFSLINGGNKSVTRGLSVTNSISANLSSGSSQAVAFSMSGLPSGATASYSSTSCNPTCSTTATVATSTFTPTGTYTVTVTGTGGGVMKTTSFNLTINAVNATTDGVITLAWNDNSDNENGFRIERKLGTSGTFNQIATVGANVSSYIDSGLTTGTTYCYRLNAFNTAGNSAYSNEACKVATTASSNFDFALTSGGNKSVTQGQAISNSVTATLTSGSSQAVSFSMTGVPAGAKASYSSGSCNPTCSSTINIATSSSTPTGPHAITVTATGGGVTKTTSFTLTVNPPLPSFDFSLANDGNKSVTRGSQVTNTVNATLTSGTTQAVSFSSSALPTGVTVSYSTTSCNPTCSTTLTFGTSASTPTGPHTINVTATGGGFVKTTSFTLTVNAPLPSFDFALANGGNKAVTRGLQVTNSITATLSSGTAQAVAFSTLPLPTGVTASFSPNSCNPNCSTIITIATSSSTLTGPHTINVTATGGGVSRTTSFTLTLNAPAPVVGVLTLTWSDNSTNETGFAIERKTGTNGTYSQITTVASNVNSYTDSTLTAGTVYCYRVRSYNSAGNSSYSNEACKAANPLSS